MLGDVYNTSLSLCLLGSPRLRTLMKQFCRRTPAFPLLRESEFFPLVRSGLSVFFFLLLVGRLLALRSSFLRLEKKGWAEKDGRKMGFCLFFEFSCRPCVCRF